jgi:hypothetical protein
MAKIEEYNGNKILCLNPEDRFPFKFGLKKAQMIMENLDTIKVFIKNEGKSLDEDGKKEE